MPVAKKVRDLLIPLSEYAVTTVDNTLKESVPVLRHLYCEVEVGRCTEAGHRSMLVLDKAGILRALNAQDNYTLWVQKLLAQKD